VSRDGADELIIKNLWGKEAKSVVRAIYHDEGNGIVIRESDLFFVCVVNGIAAASVRYCVEGDGVPMLRTMRVSKKFQRQGLGLRLLHAFAEYLDKNNIRDVFCLPYLHLDGFYGAIGFKIVRDDEVPLFLQERMREYGAKGQRVLCMRRG